DIFSLLSLFPSKRRHPTSNRDWSSDVCSSDLLNMSRTEHFAHMRERIPAKVAQAFKSDITKHAQTGIPVQQIIGYEMFFGRPFRSEERRVGEEGRSALSRG